MRMIGLSVLLPSLLGATPGVAVPVRVEVQGVIEWVTAGVGDSLDLTGTFSTGQVMTFSYVVETSTPPAAITDSWAFYLGAMTDMQFVAPSYRGSSSQCPAVCQIILRNESTDSYAITLVATDWPHIGDAYVHSFEMRKQDLDGTVLQGVELSASFPPIEAWERRHWKLVFKSILSDGGIVSGTLTAKRTAIETSSWGTVKMLYRDD